MSGTERVEGPLAPGRVVHGLVVAWHPWGIDLAFEEAEAIGTVDIRFLSDDPAEMNEDCFPPLGARLRARVQGMMPNGQLRLTIRASDVGRSDQETGGEDDRSDL